MKISQTYRSASAPQEPKAALPRLMQRLGLTVLVCTLVIGATGSASAGKAPKARQAVNGTTQVAPPISGVIGKVQSFTGSSLNVQTLQAWSTSMSSSPSQPISRYRRI